MLYLYASNLGDCWDPEQALKPNYPSQMFFSRTLFNRNVSSLTGIVLGDEVKR